MIFFLNECDIVWYLAYSTWLINSSILYSNATYYSSCQSCLSSVLSSVFLFFSFFLWISGASLLVWWLLGRYWNNWSFLQCKLGDHEKACARFQVHFLLGNISNSFTSFCLSTLVIIKSFFKLLYLTKFITCSFYDRSAPIYTQPRYLPPSKMLDAVVTDSVIGEGCVIKVSHMKIL